MTETGPVPADRGLGVVGDLRTAALVVRNVVALVARDWHGQAELLNEARQLVEGHRSEESHGVSDEGQWHQRRKQRVTH